MKSNNLFVKNLKCKNDMEVFINMKNDNIKARIVSYTKKSNTNEDINYYLLTSLMDKSIEELSDNYWGQLQRSNPQG